MSVTIYKNIVLVGFMGTGKTTVGRLLAARMGRRFIDTDCELEEELRMTITELFTRYGEDEFREREAATLARVAAIEGAAIIATGGGTVLRDGNRRLLRECGVSVCLTATAQTIIERLAADGMTRPLLAGEDSLGVVEELLEKRKKIYDEADFCIATDLLTPSEVAEKILYILHKNR